MTDYYKAVRPDGTDFFTQSVQWAPKTVKARRGRLVKHPTSTTLTAGHYSTGLAASLDITAFPGADSWPIRLLQVEPVGGVIVRGPKAMALSWRVVAELDPASRFGPQGAHVVALVERAGALTSQDAAWDAAGDAAWAAAGAAAWALVVRDLIGQHGFTQAHYDTLTRPWRTVIGPAHPDDAPLDGGKP